MKLNTSGILEVVTGDTTAVGLFASSGKTRITVVDGTTRTGLYAPDGSLNVVVVSGDTLIRSIMHPCGAIYGVSWANQSGAIAQNGAVYMDGLLLPAPEGVWYDDGDGTHSWTFTFDSNVTAGMFIKGEYSDDDFATVYESVSHELTAGDISGTPFAFTTIAFVDGDYKARFWTTDAGETINSAVSDEIPFTVVNLLADTYITAGNGGEQVITSTVATYDFAVITVGPADPGGRKMLVLAPHTNAGTAAKHNSLTIYPTATDRTNLTNGIAMTEIAGTGASADTANTNYASMWEANVGSNTTVYAQLICSAAPARVILHGWTHGRGTTTDFIEVGSNTGTIDVPSNGTALVHCGCTSAVATTSTPTGFVEDWDQFASSGTVYTTGGTFTNDASAETGMTVTATWTSSSNVRLVASAYGDKVLY